jgi:Predicted membrane-bound metal-dependent hydrolases
MDTVTHLVIGAAMGEAIGGKQLGKKVALVGAVVAVLPDLDVAVQPFLTSASAMMFHRGITHSLLFWLVVSPLLGLFAWKLFKDNNKLLWIKVCMAAWFSHIFIDSFNSYGTALFLPFSNYRVSLGVLGVVDLIITLPLLVFTIGLIFFKMRNRWSIARWLLAYTLVYMVIGMLFQQEVKAKAQHEFVQAGITVRSIHVRALPLSILAWQVVGETDSNFVLAHRGIAEQGEWHFTNFSKRWELLQQYVSNKQVMRAVRFTQGQYVVKVDGDTLWIFDLRIAPMMLDGINTKFVVSFPVIKIGGNIVVGRAYPQRIFSKESLKAWASHAF